MSARRAALPLRSCIICGTKTSKRELVRLVATPNDSVTMDPSGKQPGRGAYVCKDGNCSPRGMKRGRLEHALRTAIKDEEWAELTSSIEALNAQQ